MELRTESCDTPGTARGSAGFTLVEMMITVSLAAILIAIAVPSLRDSMASNRLTAQTNDIIAAMTLARSQAITMNQRTTFCRATSEASTTCAGSAGNWEFWLVRTASGTIVRRGTVQATSLTVTSTLTNDEVAFASDGLARSNNVLVTGGPHVNVCSSHSTTDNKRQITLGAGSRMSTAKASGGC
jgi:type IV fimbrial biogenesis protein FimT